MLSSIFIIICINNTNFFLQNKNFKITKEIKYLFKNNKNN